MSGGNVEVGGGKMLFLNVKAEEGRGNVEVSRGKIEVGGGKMLFAIVNVG